MELCQPIVRPSAPRAWRCLLLAGFLLCGLVGCGGGNPADREPTEAELRRAIQDRVDIINHNIQEMRKAPVQEGDPISAMMRLTGEAVGDARVQIAGFRKLGAVPAVGKPGWMATYTIDIDVIGGSPFMNTQFLNSLGGTNNTARFIHDGETWIFIPPAEDQ